MASCSSGSFFSIWYYDQATAIIIIDEYT